MFATEEFDGYSEEVLALAIVMTAFVALVIGKYLTLDQFHILNEHEISTSTADFRGCNPKSFC